jgi:polar amino acid transport system substrate-binding protein
MAALRFITLFLFAILLHGCSCGCGNGGRNGALRIGVDASWYPVDFGSQESYVNGFVEDLLLEVARYSGIEFERVDANWDTLLEGIREEKYEAVLTSLPPYPFNLAKYDFSENFLDLGPVLVVPVDAPSSDLGEMKGELVGIIEGDPAALILSKHPEVILRNYRSIPELLNALANGDIEGALLNQVPAASYVSDLFAGKLKIASKPMTDFGLHLAVAKGEYSSLIRDFNQSVDHLKKKKTMRELLVKWNLGN